MNLHQVLTGAVNPGDHCFSVGSIGDQRFTAYASGCDIVILGSDFERLQIIPGAKHGNIQVGCVDCSMQQGKIAASYGNVISIFEPVNLPKEKKNLELYSQWQKSGQFFLESIAHNITWDPTGSRLLTGSSYLQLWSNTNLEKPTEDENLNKTDLNFGDWRCIWHCKTASQVHLMKFSPDGEFFATAGKDDCLLKVWYNVENWRTAVTSPDRSSEKQSQGETDFSFVYLAHPRAVNGFSWRKTSKYMPRASVCNVLLTCCKDNVCRLWVETFLPNDCLLYGGDYSHWTGSINLTNNFKRNASSKERVQNALEVNLRHFRRGRRRSLALVAHTGYLPHQQDPHHVHRNTPLHANALCHFHIAASINPATDIPLLPSITSLSLNENEEKTGPFVVHWLNNKELHFTLSMEVFLQQLRKSFEQPSSEASVEDSNQADVKSDEETDDGVDDLKINPEKKELGCDKMVPNSSFTSLSSAAIDHQIEVLLSEWSKNADMLFSIHPMDGSLLVWHVDWLDEYQPGMFRQVQVSFVSRIPVAFPTGDANSLCKSIMMYACTKNVDLAIQQGKQKPSGLTRSTSMLISSGHNKSSNSLKLSIFTPNVMMISKHADGSLNQWLVSFAEESAFSTVLSISHKSRYCGHRFHLNDLACHSVLPLLLTTSHHNALRTPDVDNPKQPFDALNIEECSWTQQNKSTVDVAFQDPNAVYSELILWRVDPVGPLSFSGGVSELARINSLHVSAFSNVAWLPTLIPSYCLGAYCNSPSACFVASDGQYLRLYEAVIDAKKLLSELSNPEISKYVGEVFNIVSQQSTARPGCIIALDPITKLHGRKTQLLHVFQEDFILNNLEKKSLGKDNISSNAGSSPNGFSEKFYLIVIECTQDNRSLLHMWNLHLKSIPVSLDEKVDTKLSEAVWQPEEHYSSSPEKILSPFSQKYQACRANLQSTSKLTLFSEMVYSQELHLPEGVEIISIKPSAGHLSSSSIYPACSAPYLLATSCSDEKVRFWRCRVTDGQSATSKNGKIDLAYVWEEWPLLIEDGLQSNSSITVPGRPIEVSCAHTNRLAVAYKQPASNSRSSQDFVMHVSIFECESTGGSCWVLEQTIHLDELSTVLDSGISVDSNLVAYNKQEIYLSSKENITSNTKHLVHLDWMSREDGSHILTVGIGSKLFMYGPLAGKVQDQTAKESLAFPLWESTKVVPLSKFVLLRSVDLVSSVDGSPPFPVSLSWVRDGILVVGMDCEMHVYSQWQPSSKQEPVITDSYSGSTPSITSLMKQSNSSSGLHPPKKTLTRSMTSLAQKICGKKTAFDPSVDMEDSGLFEAAHVLSPTLPQYHPLQLLELMDLGKVRRAKAILSHLVKCIAGEVVALNEAESNHERRLRSLTISASGSTTRDPQAFNKTENTDYTEIDSVPPLPLYALLAADDDSCYSSLEKSGNESTLSKSNQLSKESYDELFQTQPVMTDTHMLETDEENTKPRVIDLSQYSPTYFGPEHAQVLSGHLLHSSLPGLSRMEQMSLMALADTIATTSTDIGESRDRSQGGETLDECGLKFLLAVRLHTFLTTSLPAYRAQLLHQDQVLSACNPTVFNFYNYLRTHPLLLRRHFGSSDTFSTHMSLTGKSGLAGTINLSERRLFFTTASAHLKAGCPMLALEVLSKMPKVIKKTRPFCRASSFLDTSKDSSPSSPLKLDAREDKSSAIDWSQSLINGFGSSSEGSSEKQSNSTLSFDWSQPSVVFQDDSLELKWDSDNDEENEDVPISMKELKPLQRKTDKKLDDVSSNYTESFSTLDENDLINPSEDIIAVQLKFRACLKILTVELRTLSTGYEIDGGKLRYQLYHWLEKEVIALQRTCDFCSDAEELQSAFGRNEGEFGLNEDAEDLPHQMKVKQLRENFQEKRQWLLKYQSLLRMFLSYCILHGSHGGGLASVRMELILLLQESQQETSEPLFSSPLSEQTSVPLLFACTANAKTVVANPLLHLSNLTHDILHAIINFDSPPHPDIQSNKVYVMHTLAASLSACIYQCLCGSHNYSSFQTNQFTGMVYQTVLLPHRHSLKTGSLDEAITPNTSPAQWPGITCLIRLLNSSGEEAQSGLTVLLCEILTAVYLSLFIHGLATHSSNELFRIVAHPLNEKMWSAVFGGGAHVPSKEQTHSKTLPGRHFAMPSPHQVVVFSMECVGFSKALSAISSHSPPSLAVSSLVEEGEKQNKRFRSSKMSCRESAPLTPSSAPVSQESLAVKEKFIPPELSIWDYFIAKPFLPPSQSRPEYDSEESLGSDDDDDDDDDVLASDFHLQEHSNSNSYSWSLMRLAMVQLVLNNLKTFYPFAGHDLAELPVSSPLCHAVLKTLQCWEQVLLRRLEIHGGPPQNYIASHTSEESLSAGPAILRHKALLEPTNTPFKSKHHLALSVKRLWQYLVKQEEIQETFIKNIFTKKRCLNESLEDNSETIKNSMMEEPNINKIEADLGYPGGKARIIHKESDIITAFAVNKANRNCIAIASSHDVQELDVSGILATQIYTWVDDDIEVETKGSEDFLVIHARDDLTAVQGTTPYTHSNPGTPINMPWLGSTQTGRGASVMIKKAINNVRRMTSHPTLPYYLTGAQDGSVRMFEWGHSQEITCFRSGGNSRVTRMRFNYQGNKFGIVDADGYLSLYQTNWKCCPVTGSMPKPYLTWQCHNKTANDFVFVSSSSLIATAGLSTDNRNVCLWDTLVAPANSLVHAFTCHDSGATVLAYAPKHQLLISGGRKGFTYAFDLCQRQQRQLFQSHDSPVKAIAVDPTEEYFVTGSAEGNIKIWSLSTFGLLHTFVSEHARQSIFRNIGTGVMQIETGPANHIFSCGADGTMKMRILPDQFSPLNEVLKNDVKFML
ncbi:PREDICTED: dmX-like protein 1 isoform X10 [Cercocebus atys]|uniref:dmX-like protein 1 isoform X10 n=1 Tax=Cercocebus atys TaxID=9531 RepID=UPI0005F51F67|nr:PREDICTED: dmX-like protein 1 isoform X10 [Cercocebus atys]